VGADLVNRKSQRSDEFKVGFTVLVAAIVLVVGIFWGKGLSFRQQHKTYQVQFEEVYGLKEGSSVLVQGVARGKVGQIRLNEKGAIVTVQVDEGIPIYQDARVALFSPQLMGGRTITIDPGSGPQRLEPGSTLVGEVPAGVGEVMASSGQVLTEIRDVIVRLNTIVTRVDSAIVGTRMVQRIDSSLADLTTFTGTAREELLATSSALRQGAETIRGTSVQFDRMLASNQPRFDSLMINLEAISGDAEQISVNLEQFTEALNSREGSLGRFVYDDELHSRLATTLANLDSLIVQLKSEGVNVSIF
jgi:phospholipid/cholesterol/gamma-HCH transport system substrate-binding protein